MIKIKTPVGTGVDINDATLLSYNSLRISVTARFANYKFDVGEFIDALLIFESGSAAYVYQTEQLRSFACGASILILEKRRSCWIFEFTEVLNEDIKGFAQVLRKYDECELKRLIWDLFSDEPLHFFWWCA
jgi:hypothetical protein